MNEELNMEKIQKIGNEITEVLKNNDAFDKNGFTALASATFTFLKAVAEADENGKKKERMRMLLNQMLDDYFIDVE